MRIIYDHIPLLINPTESNDYNQISTLENAAFVVENDTIIAIGKSEEIYLQYPNLKRIALNGIVLPGFIDAHTHPVFWKTREHEFVMLRQMPVQRFFDLLFFAAKFTISQLR